MRLIDADELLAKAKQVDLYLSAARRALYKLIHEALTVEAEPIVRCKDCVNFHKYGLKLEYTECKHFDCDVCEDGFCAWGVRKDEEEE